ncbi:MAG: flippase-like domain-containing protein [Archaeoglobus sp.]|nr:flippase-like domain-containing protein [Archaeoglobus sp.]
MSDRKLEENERSKAGKILKIVIQGVVGLIILLAIYLKVRDYDLSETVYSMNIPFFFCSAAFYFLLNLSLAFRLKKVVETTGCFVRFRDAVIAHLGGMILSDLTPGRSGYLSTPFFLRRASGCELNRGMAGILVPQAIEFLVKIFGAFMGLILLASVTEKFREILGFSAVAMALLFGVSALIILGSWSRYGDKIPFPSFIRKRLQAYTEQSVKTRESLGIILSLTLFGWFLTAFQWYFIGLTLSLQLSFLHFLLLQPLITLLMFIPLTPAGLGIMEGGAVAILFLLGVDPSTAFLYSILVRLSTLLADLPGLITVAKASINFKLT